MFHVKRNARTSLTMMHVKDICTCKNELNFKSVIGSRSAEVINRAIIPKNSQGHSVWNKEKIAFVPNLGGHNLQRAWYQALFFSFVFLFIS